MASRIVYVGDGSTNLFSIPFSYLDRTHVKVKINGADLSTSAYSFPSDGTVQTTSTPAAGARVMVYRETPDEALTVYQSGSVLSRDDLEVDSLQALYRIEEMEDRAVILDTTSEDAGKLAVVDDDGSWALGEAVDVGSVLTSFTQVGVGAKPRSAAGKLQETISLLDYVPEVQHEAILDGTSAYDATADMLDAITAAAGRPVMLPPGLILAKEVTAASAWFIGAGEGVTEVRLFGGGTEQVFIVDSLRIESLTLSDGGRASMDHTGTPDAVLATCVNTFDADLVSFATDRSVLAQAATSDESYTSVTRCKVSRPTAPGATEEDQMNLFVMTNVLRVHFSRLDTSDLVGRSIVNATYTQSGAGVNAPATATVEHCNFDLFRTLSDAEVKIVFLQGYLENVQYNHFRDCFGRHVDFLSNYNAASADGTFYKGVLAHNKVDYTTANAAVTGADNDEAGSFYCRYADVLIYGNHQDFTNLALVSNTYNAIAVRHGYKAAHVLANTIISPKAHAIECDISDAIDTDECNVYIVDNVVQNATNSSRRPISVANNSAESGKVFDNVVIRGNSVEYPHSYIIVIDVAPPLASAFSMKALSISGNWHKKATPDIDTVEFFAYPERLYAPNVTLSIPVDPGMVVSSAGVIPSMDEAIACIGTYECKQLTIYLWNLWTTDWTVTGPTTLSVKPRKLVVDGDNGLGGRIRFYTDGASQTGLNFTLDGNQVEFDGCKFASDAGVSTTNLVRVNGHGHVLAKTCDVDDAESFILTTGPDVSIKGGTVDGVTLGSTAARGVIATDSDRLVRCSIEDTTGANNYRLYNCLSPAVMVTENVAGLTVSSASVKASVVA